MLNFDLQVRKHAALDAPGPLLFLIARNEEMLLPHFFRYYRSLGVEKFVVFDDQSTDRTHELLQAQENCMVLGAQTRFGSEAGHLPGGRTVRFANLLRQQVPLLLEPTGWVLTVDADEFLVLPPGFETIARLIAELDRAGQPCLAAPMVEFYPQRLCERNYAAGTDPFVGCPYFDAGPYYDWSGKRVPTMFMRGIRARLTLMLHHAHPERAKQIFGDSLKLPSLNKVPLLKNGQGLVRGANAHELTVAPPQGLSASLAHFKFGPDLDQKIEYALSSGAYENSSMGYRFLRAAIEAFDETPLLSGESRTYAGPRSLHDAGLM